MQIGKYKKGLTLIELTIVLAIISIISGVLIQIFVSSTDRARLRADILSAQAIQSAMGIYRAERGRSAAANSSDMDDILQELIVTRYIDRKNSTTQTEDAKWVYHEDPDYGWMVMVDIGDSPPHVHEAFETLTDNEQMYVLNAVSSSTPEPTP